MTRIGELRRVPWRGLLAAGVAVLALSVGLARGAGAAPGDLDPTFGSGGTVISTAGWGYVNALVLQPDGKLVAAGGLSGKFLLARYNADGSLDSSFGSGGKTPDDFSGIGGEFSALVLQPDGKLVAAVLIEDGFGRWAFALARHNADGSLDSSFGSGGKVTTNFSSSSFDQAYALVLQPDGKLVAAGLSHVADGNGGGGFTCFPFCPPPDPGTSSFALVRYNADGSLDSSFGTDGKVITNLGASNGQARALVLQPDGKLVAAGGSGGNFALARYNANGSIDSSFGASGRVITNFGGFGGAAYALVLQPDGKLVAAGSSIPNFALARYTASGSLDPTFGSGGKVITDFGGIRDAYALVLQPDGKLVAAGGSNGYFALARYNANGSIDSSFGASGRVITNINDFSRSGAAYALVLQPDGKLVAGGAGPCTTFSCNFILARYIGDLPTPTLAAAVLPTERTGLVGGPDVTAFGNIINASETLATACGIAPLSVVPATFTYQTTTAQNALTGTVNTPVDIPPGGIQNYVFAFGATAPFPRTEVVLSFNCAEGSASSLSGVNTFFLRGTATPAPDLVAIALTPSADGIVHLASAGAFAVATVNLGTAGLMTVSADTGGVALPVSLFICETNPGSGQCLADPTPSVQTQINAGATPTFGVFVNTDQAIAFDPANHRVQVHIEGGGGGGGTGLAVCTQPLCQ